jgi:hypothetical protein
MRFACHLILAACMLPYTAFCQTPAPSAPTTAIASHPEWPKAKPSDVDSVEHILAAVYDAISGPAKQPRDWVRFRSLFVPGGRLIPIRATGSSSDITELSIDDYVTRAGARLESDGFFEHATHNTVDQFGDLVQVFSTYESRHMLTDPVPFARGINSFQLLRDGNRYWVVTIYWEAERPDLKIPSKYLPPPPA